MTNEASRASRPGRPRRSSAEILADAASELFLENGYAGTTVDQITSRAGVSRATFFNYFEGKADLLWVDLDRSLAHLEEALRASSSLPVVVAVVEALTAVAARHDDDRVPLALTQAEAMRLGDELVASGAIRFVAVQSRVAAYVAERTGRSRLDLEPQVVASTTVAAAAAAFGAWARHGIGRPPLADLVRRALGPVSAGLAG